jgi:hypothetical protein
MSNESATRPCPRCGQNINVKQTRCQHCFALVGLSWEPRAATTSQAPAGTRAMRRYRDAYAVANAIDAEGQRIKIFAIIAAVGIGILTLPMMAAAPAGALSAGVLLFGGLAAFMAWALIHNRGVLVAAEGQMLLAALDTAVHTSPFLTDAEREQAMSL